MDGSISTLYSSIGPSSDPYKEGSKLINDSTEIFPSLKQDLNRFRIF